MKQLGRESRDDEGEIGRVEDASQQSTFGFLTSATNAFGHGPQMIQAPTRNKQS
jgi:hypothetical protein